MDCFKGNVLLYQYNNFIGGEQMKIKTFSELLKDLRIDSDMTQEQVAKELGISVSHYGHFEAGIREPNLHTLIGLCKLFHVSSDYLLGITEDETLEPLLRQVKALPRMERDKVAEYADLLYQKYRPKKK